MTRRSLLVIHNPTAGRRRRQLGRVLDALARDGIKAGLAPTAHAGHAVELSRDGHGFDAVVAAGGDGSVNEVATIIPLGTANVPAIELGYPSRAETIAALLACGAARAERPGRIAAIAAGQASAWTDMRIATARELWLDTPAGDPAQVDGDLVARLPALVSINPASVGLIAPQPSLSA